MPTVAEIADELIARWGGVPIVRDPSREYTNNRDMELDLQPYDIRLFDLSVAQPSLSIPFDGNVVAFYHFEGAPAAQTPYINLRYESVGNKPIPIFGELTIKKRFTEVFFSWAALGGGYAAVLLGTDFQV